MNANTVTRQYSKLTPKERFRLIAAAVARNDEVERDRLAAAGEVITLTMRDHVPLQEAFYHMERSYSIAMHAAATAYLLASHRLDDADLLDGAYEAEPEDDVAWVEEEDKGGGDAAGAGYAGGVWAEEDPHRELTWLEWLHGQAREKGYMLKMNAEGWKLFCGRIGIPPSLDAWEGLPGFHDVQLALRLLEKGAFPRPFSLDEVRQWRGRDRDPGEPEVTEAEVGTAELLADELEKIFRDNVVSWGG
jgi:hypothetical protein